MTRITGILLAGGTSSRMNTPKEDLIYRSKSFLEIGVSNLQQVCDQVLLISNSDIQFQGTEAYADLYKEAGPLAGLHSGLTYSSNDLNLLMACDMPRIKPEHLELILEQASLDYDAVIPRVNGKEQLICAVYNRSVLPRLEENLILGTRKVYDFVKLLNIKYWEVPEDSVGFFKNVNTPEDYTELNSLP